MAEILFVGNALEECVVVGALEFFVGKVYKDNDAFLFAGVVAERADAFRRKSLGTLGVGLCPPHLSPLGYGLYAGWLVNVCRGVQTISFTIDSEEIVAELIAHKCGFNG